MEGDMDFSFSLIERVKLFIHDGLLLLGFFCFLFWILVILGEVKGICSLPFTERVWAFNMEGRDYVEVRQGKGQ